jgi:hypothetical protein
MSSVAALFFQSLHLGFVSIICSVVSS